MTKEIIVKRSETSFPLSTSVSFLHLVSSDLLPPRHVHPELLQREQAEMAQQLANLQTDVRMSYGNDALMPDQELGDGQTDLLPQEDTLGLGGVGFIHPESFNQPNTENQGTY